jgi:hypothetical protein
LDNPALAVTTNKYLNDALGLEKLSSSYQVAIEKLAVLSIS